jgi:3-oxoacyl-[acyl-carrier protein] reductase
LLVERFGEDRILPVQADLSTEGGCVATVAMAGTQPTTLVHCAGIWNDGAIRGLSFETLDLMFRTNTYSAYFLAREMARMMDGGSMIFVGSTAGQRGEPGHSHYAGSKAALWGLVQSLAQELAPKVRVNLVSPGWVRTPMAEEVLADEARATAITNAIPLRRVAEIEDLVAAVSFLADDSRSRHLTGIDLSVSGGALLPVPRG